MIEPVGGAAEQPGLFPDWDVAWLAQELERAEKSDASLLPTKEAAERILVELFGTLDDVKRILELPTAAWADEVLRAYLRALRDCGATHVTRVAIFDDEKKGAYYLIHVAKNPMATLKMKEAMHSAISKSGLPDATKRWIRFSHAVRISEVVEAVRRRFAGQDVRWTEKPQSPESVQGFGLSETPMTYDQVQQLKDELASYVIEQRPLRFGFPAE